MPEHTPRAPEEAVEACDNCGSRYAEPWWASSDLWCKVAGEDGGSLCPECFTRLAAAAGLKVAWSAYVPGETEPAAWETAEREYQARRKAETALAERDREWREALLSDKARRALVEMVGSAYDRGSVLTLEAVIEAALDSLQVSGTAQPDTTEVIAEIGEALAADQPDQDRSPGEVDELVERLREYVPPAEPQPGTDEAARNRQQYRRDLIAAIERLAAQQPDPQGQEGGAAEFTAEQEIADRQIVISFDGGPLSNGAGFARDLRPIQLAEGTYRFLEFGSDGDAVFEWGPTHYVDHSTQPHTSFGDQEGADRG